MSPPFREPDAAYVCSLLIRLCDTRVYDVLPKTLTFKNGLKIAAGGFVLRLLWLYLVLNKRHI
jgi:hypothetical protein